MSIIYTDTKNYTSNDLKELFQSVGWLSANYPERLKKALDNSETVFAAWDKDKLVGLIRVLDDSEMTAFIHYVLVHPDYQGLGIAGHMMGMLKEKYQDYLYIDVMPEEAKNASFYEKHGFKVNVGGTTLSLINPGRKY